MSDDRGQFPAAAFTIGPPVPADPAERARVAARAIEILKTPPASSLVGPLEPRRKA